MVNIYSIVWDSHGFLPVFPDAVTNGTKFYSQKCSGLKDKLYGHPKYKGLAQCGTANQLQVENQDCPILLQGCLPLSHRPLP